MTDTIKADSSQLDKYQYIRHVFDKKKKHFYQVTRNDSVSRRINKLILLKEKILEHREAIEDALYTDLKKPKEEMAVRACFVPKALITNSATREPLAAPSRSKKYIFPPLRFRSK